MVGGQARLLAFTSDEAQAALLRQALAGSGIPRAEVRPGNAEAALQEIGAGQRPDFLIVDIEAGETALFDISALATATEGRTVILALGQANDIAFYRNLRAAGAGEYLLKPASAEQILAALAERAGTREGQASRGEARTVAVIGARGGLGASGIAIGIAWILAEERGQKTALVDLDLQFGTIPLALDIAPGRGLREALEQPDRIDSLFIERASEKVGANLFVLGSEEPIEDRLTLSEAAVATLLGALREKCQWIVLDLPRGPGLQHARILAEASHVVVLAEPTLAGIRDAMRLQALVRESAPGAELLLLAAARPTTKSQNISMADFERSLGQPPFLTLPWDIDAETRAAAAGKPVPEAARESRLAQAMRRLVTRLAGAPKVASRRSLFGWLAGKS
ncbi:MAG: P-loop NTPase [Alphaproteobacteria bacterium]|nr:P-loop NTPase [Alphaproteobacteria bacterium]